MFEYLMHAARLAMTRSTFRLLLGFAAMLALLLVFGVVLPWVRDFRRELRYINMEIQRTDGRERRHWEKKKKRLWLSLLPFYHYH